MRKIETPTTEGVVTEHLYSACTGWVCLVKWDDASEHFCVERDLEPAPVRKEFSMEVKIDIEENVVIATLYECTDDAKTVISKGHGHLIHEGELGIAKAASYACMRLYKKIGGQL